MIAYSYRVGHCKVGWPGPSGTASWETSGEWRLPVSCITSWWWTQGPVGDLQLALVHQRRGLLLCRMFQGWGRTTQHGRQSVCGRSSPPTSMKRVLFPGNTIDNTKHNQMLIHIEIRVFFHLLSYVNCSCSIPSFSPFTFYLSGEGAVQWRVMSVQNPTGSFKSHPYWKNVEQLDTLQWGKNVFSQPPIVQVLPLKKMREACNFLHRYISTMTDKIRKQIQKITL
jgi:hypothetical protein